MLAIDETPSFSCRAIGLGSMDSNSRFVCSASRCYQSQKQARGRAKHVRTHHAHTRSLCALTLNYLKFHSLHLQLHAPCMVATDIKLLRQHRHSLAQVECNQVPERSSLGERRCLELPQQRKGAHGKDSIIPKVLNDIQGAQGAIDERYTQHVGHNQGSKSRSTVRVCDRRDVKRVPGNVCNRGVKWLVCHSFAT